MDKSELYIKMCDHPLIQDRWKLTEGDFVYWPSQPPAIEVFDANAVDAWSTDEVKREHGGGVWLPRQDQLQGMVFSKDYGARTIIKALWDACEKHGSLIPRVEYGFPPIGTVDESWSMEQLLLSFVMHELHQLKWDGNKWEKVGGITQ